jgi:hypothetical protein
VKPLCAALAATALLLAPGSLRAQAGTAPATPPDTATAAAPPKALLPDHADDRPQPVRRRSDVITPEEIRASHLLNAYELVAHLRPQWLRTRRLSVNTIGVRVYYNGFYVGGPEALRQYDAASLTVLRYVNSNDARRLYDASVGVIAVMGR